MPSTYVEIYIIMVNGQLSINLDSIFFSFLICLGQHIYVSSQYTYTNYLWMVKIFIEVTANNTKF